MSNSNENISHQPTLEKCPECNSTKLNIKKGKLNRKTGKRIRPALRLFIASMFFLCSASYIILGFESYNDGFAVKDFLLPILIVMAVFATPGALILFFYFRMDKGILDQYTCSACNFSWKNRDGEIILGDPPDPKTSMDTTYKLPPDAPSNTTYKLPTDVSVVSKPKEKPEEIPRAQRFKGVKLAYPQKIKRTTTNLRLFIITLIGSILGVLLMWIAVQFGRNLDKLFLVVAWFIPGIVAWEIVREWAQLPNFDRNPLGTLIMFSTISIVGILGSLPLIEEYELNTWVLIIILIISAGYFSMRPKDKRSINRIILYPYCEECESFLEPEFTWGYKIEDTEEILSHLNTGTINQVANFELIKNPNKDIAKLQIHSCSKCNNGMVSLFLSGEYSGNIYRGLPIYSQKETSEKLNEIVGIIEK